MSSLTAVSGPLGAFAVALGAGLLIGIERERRKGEGDSRAAAGVRTFTLVALLGALAGVLDAAWLMAVLAAGVVILAAVSYWRSSAHDPGLTTEVALLATFGIGVLATPSPALAAGLGVIIAMLLAARTRLHAFAQAALTERELGDAILLAGAAMIVLPLLPDRAIDPWGALNPYLVWRLTLIVMLVNAAGYVAQRWLGPRWGLPIAGLFGGFVSSVATIGAMAQRARASESLLPGALAGAALSSFATVVQLALVIGATDATMLQRLALPLAAMGLVALAVGAWLGRRGLSAHRGQHQAEGRAFDPRYALLFSTLVVVMLVGIALLQRAFGSAGVLAGAVVGGFLDTHSAAASVASLARTQAVGVNAALWAIGLAVSANTVTKLWVAVAGGRRYFLGLAPGLIAMLAALWAGITYVIAAAQ